MKQGVTYFITHKVRDSEVIWIDNLDERQLKKERKFLSSEFPNEEYEVYKQTVTFEKIK